MDSNITKIGTKRTKATEIHDQGSSTYHCLLNDAVMSD